MGKVAADQGEESGRIWDEGRRLGDWGLADGGSAMKMAEGLPELGSVDVVVKG